MRILTAVALVAIVVLIALWQGAERRADRVEARVRHVLDSLTNAAGVSRAVTPALSPSRIAELRRAGLPDPERNLRDSLLAHPELIPYPGIHGGTMGFYEEAIVFLPESEQIWAYFEDGHVGGTMLLEYWVEPGVKVHWKVLWSRPL